MSAENKEDNNSMSSDVKDEVNPPEPEEVKAVDDSSKDSEKDSVKEEDSIKEESGKDDSEKDDSEKDDSEEEKALLDRPVEVTGCRARKKVERLELTFALPKEKVDIPEGKGQKLGECPRIEHQIQKTAVNDLKPLHKILFNRVGSAAEIKKNIRKFCGFPFEKGSNGFARKKTLTEKLTLSILKHVCEVLDLERSGTKDELVTRVLNFLLDPKDSGKKVKSKKKVSRKSSDKKVRNSEKKRKDKSKANDDEPESHEDDSDAEASEASDSDNAESDEEPKKKSKHTGKAKYVHKVKSEKMKASDKLKKEEKKTPAKGSKRKRDNDMNESSEEEPIAKKNKMPSDEEITKLVKRILDAADLQEITMKKVIEQVSDAYPDFDLSHKKAFIKTTIKSVIS